ncbi:hypothetical protein RHODOSMS8_00462 [Rhodobiaceae bacterium]|nr:hypothetical protein RHODOSMS8_00462 [Rhodobiaceae bacterium]
MLEDKRYGVEHALNMYAYSFALLPAESIYDSAAINTIKPVTDNCHIYLIGFVPRVTLINAREIDDALELTLEVFGESHTVELPMPEGSKLVFENEVWFVQLQSGEKVWPSGAEISTIFHGRVRELHFDVQYIGQAYGADGSRNAIDRLLSHEKLQKISLQGVPDDHYLALLLLEVEPNTTVITLLNGMATESAEDEARIDSGLDKLFGTSEQERISIYEASLIRYFEPKFNLEFKNSFPSTRLKILQDCYEKDFASVIAEICIDELPFRLCSEKIEPKFYHTAVFDLHKESDRKVFFSKP